MKAYRIGRIAQPWLNLTPPIRLGLVTIRTTTDAPKDQLLINVDAVPSVTRPIGLRPHLPVQQDFDCALVTPPSTAPSTSSCIGSDDEDCTRLSLSKATTGQTSVSEGEDLPPEKSTPSKPEFNRDCYTASLEQDEIDQGIRDYPPLDHETQEAIALDYRALHEEVKARGLYQCRYSEYGKELIRCGILFSIFLLLLRSHWYITSSIILGVFWQQIMFSAHDAGHRGITGGFVTDTLIGAFVADFCCGLSIGWWKSSHNVHHLCTNMPEHDPDIQNVPIFSNSPTFMKSITSTFYDSEYPWDAAADIVIPYQKYLYYPVMAVARFNLYMLSWLHLISPRATQLGSAWWTRYVELAFMTCYWFLFGYVLVLKTLPDWPTRVAFVVISHMATMILHVQITLSHWGMPTSDLGPTESFPQRQLRTTMDVDCPEWLDFVHGGLQFQAVHHLFPRVPRHNLRQVQTLVREFCHKTGVKYQCHGFVEGNKVVLSRLDEISRMVQTLADCQAYMAKTGESGLH